jgi:autotransporter strand-loop-strand O-heptosyltransferase
MIDGNNMKASIVLRTYKRPEFLKQALKSVEYQSSSDWELIVFDDHGSLENREIINNFKLRNPKNRVVYLTTLTPLDLFKKSWTYMLDLSEGDILIRLDDDDLLTKDCVEYLNFFYKKYPELDFSYGSSVFFENENLIEIIEGMTPHELPKTKTAWIPYTIENNSPWSDPLMYQDDYYDEPQNYTSIIHASKLNKLCVFHTYSMRVNSLRKVKGKIDIQSNCVDDLEIMGTLEYLGLKHSSVKKILTYVRNHNNERISNIIKNNIDETRKKVDYLRPSNFISNILNIYPEDKKILEINNELKQNFLSVYNYCTDQKIKLLLLAPHLSTGGMPAYVLKKIETLQKYSDKFDIYVVEFSTYSDTYVVQRNKIIDLIPKDRFFTLGDMGGDKSNLINILKDNNINILHVDEIFEGFDSFNKVPENLLDQIYSNDRTWKVVETCHNVWFDYNNKKYNPDAFAFCTPYHPTKQFINSPSYYEVFEFPIDDKSPSKELKEKTINELGLNPDKIHILNVGLWTSGKNQGEGVEIARILEKTNPELHFHFLGNQASNFEDYWQPIMNNLPSNVTVWGERDDVDKFMIASDLFMFNSTWECNPLVLREAISYGLKIVSRNLPQYMNMFTQYINVLSSTVEENSKILLDTIKKDRIYEIPKSQEKEFALKFESFYEKINLTPTLKQEKMGKTVSITQHFVNNPFLEIVGEPDNKKDYLVKFFDENNVSIHEQTIKANHWIKLNREYFTRWNAKIWEDGNLIYDNTLNFENKRIYISFDSSSLGDTIAWIPYCLEFKKKHKCNVIVSTFWNKLFEKTYPELEFITPGSVAHNLYGMYRLGWFYDSHKEPVLPNTIPLQKAATNILGLDYKEIIPELSFKIKNRPLNEKYVTIATSSTAGLKFWQDKDWEKVVNFLIENGYKVVNVSKEKNVLKNVQQFKDSSIEETINTIYHSDFFIGLSSGLSWLAWAIKKQVVMIANFTSPDHEFQENCIRITNPNVCNGCWNNPNFKFDKGDWNWCPIWKNTDKQFECHKSITGEMVIKEIKKII